MLEAGSRVFTDWEIVREIGKGASGAVFEIQKVQQDVSLAAALKVINIPEDPDMTNALQGDGLDSQSVTGYLQKIVDELVEEIKIMISVKGFPYVVNCEDYEVIKETGAARWTVLIRMELLQPVSQFQQTNDLSEADVWRMAVHLTKALVLLEERNMIHRDIKPENIFVNKFGDFKLGDFGIARVCDQTNMAMSQKGTQSYMAPEVYRGLSYDQTVDIYSLGLVLYKYLNKNRLPFLPTEGTFTPMDRQSAQAMRLNGKKELPAPVSASDGFARIILKMCAYRPEDRYTSASMLLKDLETLRPDNSIVLKASGSPSENRDGRLYGSDRDSGKMFLTSGVKAASASNAPVSEKKNEQPSEQSKDDMAESKSGEPSNNANVNAHSAAQKTSATTSGRPGGLERPGSEEAAARHTDNHNSKKKSRKPLLVAAALVAVALAMLIPVFLSREYTLNVSGGSGAGSYKAGAAVAISANKEEGKRFLHWISKGVRLSEDELLQSQVSFKMPRGKVEMIAVYEDIAYALTVNSGSGSGDYVFGSHVCVTADKPETGYAFKGWTTSESLFTTQALQDETLSFAMPSRDLTLTAEYVPLSYRLKVTGAQGSGTYSFGDQVILEAPEVQDSTFQTWLIDKGDIKLTDEEKANTTLAFFMPASDIQISAVYKTDTYAVTVNKGAGSGTYEVGSTVEITADTAASGMSFRQWKVKLGKVSLDDVSLETTSFVMPSRDIVIEAEYAPLSFALKVDNADGSGNVDYGKTVRLTAKEVNYSTFVGWTVIKGDIGVDEEELEKTELSFTMPAEDVSIRAEYALNTHYAAIQRGEGSGTYAVGDTVEIQADAAEEGMKFTNWQAIKGRPSIENSSLETTRFAMPDQDVIVEAQYAAISYSLTIEGGSGAGKYEYGDVVTIKATSREGSSFSHWNVVEGQMDAATGKKLQSGTLTFNMPACDLVLEAIYQLNEHAVTIDKGEGSGTYTVGGEITITADDAPEGYGFAGWKVLKGRVSLDNPSLMETSFIMPDQDVAIEAQYTALSFSLTVDNALGSGKYDFGDPVVLELTDQPGSHFERWEVKKGALSFTEDQLSASTLEFTMPASDVRIAAVFAKNIHTVTVTGGSGSGSYSVGDMVTISADVMPLGQKFDGWTLLKGKPSLENASLEETSFIMPDQDVSIEVKLKAIEYTLLVNNGSGGGKYSVGTMVSITAPVSQGEMRFDGWTVDSGSISFVDPGAMNLTFSMPAEDLIITAHYSIPKSVLRVINGTGSGMYTVGEKVEINCPATNDRGMSFAGWSIMSGSLDTNGLDLKQNTLEFNMPENDIAIQANYSAVVQQVSSGFVLTVNGGSGSGKYPSGTKVTIEADPDSPGSHFSGWLINGYPGDVDASQATLEIIMPDNDVIFTAFFSN